MTTASSVDGPGHLRPVRLIVDWDGFGLLAFQNLVVGTAPTDRLFALDGAFPSRRPPNQVGAIEMNSHDPPAIDASGFAVGNVDPGIVSEA